MLLVVLAVALFGIWTMSKVPDPDRTAWILLAIASVQETSTLAYSIITLAGLLFVLREMPCAEMSCSCRCKVRPRKEPSSQATLVVPGPCACNEHTLPPPPPGPPPDAPPPPRTKNSLKRPRIANVRKGCIIGRQTLLDEHKTPGPKKRANAKRNTRKQGQLQRAREALAKKLDLPNCVWRTSKFGGKRTSNDTYTCCNKKCNKQFEDLAGSKQMAASYISQYRNYYHSLDNDKKRLFWDDHTYYEGYTKHLEGGELRKHARHFTYLLEPFQLMSKQLQRACFSKEVFAPMPKDQLNVVCQRMLVFATAGHNDTANQHSIRKAFHADGGSVPPEQLDCGIPNQRSEYKDRPQPKADTARLWVHDQGKLALLDPTKDVSILPFRTVQSAHAFYIFSHEYASGKEWVPNALEAWKLAEDGVAEDVSCEPEDQVAQECDLEELANLPWDADIDAEEEEKAAQRARNQKKQVKFRYGNKRCGPTDPNKPEDDQLATYSYFAKVWRADETLRNIICREHLPFAKCNLCIRQRQNAEKLRTAEEVLQHHEELRQHLTDVKKEKMYYYSNRARARREPDSIMSIIIDGADQSKFDLPHFKDRSHLLSESKLLKMHVYGALVHGAKGGAYAYVIPDHEEQGHNTTINVLHHILVRQLKRHKKLPPILKLQLDNTTKQNKGQFLYGYLDLLVEFGVFENVEVSFLPVGHTHEDIDQFFSRISVYLRSFHDPPLL